MDDIASHMGEVPTVSPQTQAEMQAGAALSSAATNPADDDPKPSINTQVAGQSFAGQPAVKSNRDDDKKSLMKDARQFGKADGEGKRAFVRFARLLVQGGAAKVLTPSPKSQDASDMYGAFADSSNTAAGGLTDEKKASTAAQLSKVRAFIRLGAKFEDDAEPIFDDALAVHKHIMATPELSELVKLRSSYAALCSIAVAQCKPEANGQRLTPDQMKALLLNEPVEEKERTGADVLVQALNLIESAIRGRAPSEKSNGREPVNHADSIHEINPDQVDRQRGMDVTVVTTATTNDEGRALLRLLGFPVQGELTQWRRRR